MQAQPKSNPSAKQGWTNISQAKKTQLIVVENNPEPEHTQKEAFEMITSSNRPIIIITKDSASAYGGMMKYISESFPNIPIIVEDGGNIHGGPINDVYMAGSSYKSNMMHNGNQSRFDMADTVIIFGKNSETIAAFSTNRQKILSQSTVENGVNIATASFSDTMIQKGNAWKSWNNQCITQRGLCI
jgi:hypothetical protein